MGLTALIIGEGNLPRQCADVLEKAGYTVAAVCSPDTPLKEWGDSKSVPHFTDVKEFDTFSAVTSHHYLFSIVNFAKLPNEMLHRPIQFAINYHDAPLPTYAGLYATSWAILNGEKAHGITWHVMVDKVDAGDILEQVRFPISPRDTAYKLNLKCYFAAVQSFTDLAAKLRDGNFIRIPQDLSARTYYGLKKWPPILPSDCPPEHLDRYRRATDFGPRPVPAPQTS